MITSSAQRDAHSYPESAIRVTVFLMIAYVTTTMLQGLFGTLPVNRLVGFALVVLLAYEWISSKKSHLAYLVLCGFIILALRSLSVASDVSQEIADWVYLASTLLVLALIGSSDRRIQVYSALLRYRSFIQITVAFAVLLLLGLLVTRTGYVVAWGEEPYFKGLCNTEHTLASICILLLVLIVFLSRTGEPLPFCAFASAIVLFALLETGARTYLVPGAICALLLIDGMVNHGWLKVILVFLLVLIGGSVFMGSGMMNKFMFAQGNIYADSLLSAVTNGRNEIWLTDLLAWLQSGPIGLVIGSSFSRIYSVNEAALSLSIWAHNDFIMLLFGTGLIGLVLYSGCLAHVFKNMARSLGKRDFAVLALFVLFPLFFNGFFPYQHLVFGSVFLFVICDCSNSVANVKE